jgi:quinol monooxygenase YgiN
MHEKNDNEGDHMETLRCVSLALLLAALSAGIGAGAASAGTIQASAHASSSASRQPLTVVTHLDVARVSLDRALALFGNYVRTSRAEPGNVSVEVLRQVNVPNHFTLVEVWTNRATYDAHISAESTREFHRQLDPLLGSPHDERLFAVEHQ